MCMYRGIFVDQVKRKMQFADTSYMSKISLHLYFMGNLIFEI